MPVRNSEIAAIFYRMADLLEIEGANSFRVRAYRGAADALERLPTSAAAMLKQGEPLTSIHGVGQEMAKKIEEIVETGRLKQLDEIQQRTPPEMVQLLKVGGLGPRRVQMFYSELGVKNIKDLREAAQQGRIRDLPGFGDRLEKNILEELTKHETGADRVHIDRAETIARPILAYMKSQGKIEQIEVAGSFRRRKETVGDLDILAISPDGPAVIDHFVAYEGVRDVLMQGETRSTVILASGLQVDLRVVARESYGAALLYFTGSKPHTLHLRLMAMAKGWKINEYGLYAGETLRAGATEAEMYQALGLDWVPPELREDSGEIEAAAQQRLPALVRVEDLRGDLQSHTTASDGRGTLESMARKAIALGYNYLAITDHSRRLTIAHGLDVEDLARQIDAIDALNERIKNWKHLPEGGFRLLKSSEVDILEDGSLDLPDDILTRLDLRVCSIHSSFRLSREKQTTRVLRAMDNPCFNIFAHPTGRLLLKRSPYEIDLERVLSGARERGCFLEINAHPERLDLNDTAVRLAKDMGVMLSISTDAHSMAELDYMRCGVDQARHGWLSPSDVLNTRDWTALQKILARNTTT